MDSLLLVSLSRYLADECAGEGPRSRSPRCQKKTPVSDPMHATKPLQQRRQPTLNEPQENRVIEDTLIYETVIPLQNLRPEASQCPQAYHPSADPPPTGYPRGQQGFGQSPQELTQVCQDFRQFPQGFEQSPQGTKQFSHGKGHPAPTIRRSSQAANPSLRNYRISPQGSRQAPQGYEPPTQGFGQAPPQNYGQSPEGYPQLSSLGYGHELTSPNAKAPAQAGSSHPGHWWTPRNAPRADRASASASRWRPSTNDDTLIIPHRARRVHIRPANVVVGALLGFAAFLYLFLI
jgi:hypothetical protein